MKCDEAKPACLKCAQTGRKCDGYSLASPRGKTPLTPLVDAEPNTERKTKGPLATKSFYSLPFKIPGSQSDRQLFHYFCVHAATDLAGFSYGSTEFWSQLVLECSHHEPVVRSALIAVASIHRNYVTDEGENGALVNLNPLEEYNKAIRRLRRYMESQDDPNRKVVLICCALFYCFESTRGEQNLAIKHLQSALDILNQRERLKEPTFVSDGNRPSLEMDTLAAFFSQLDIQASMYAPNRQPSLLLISDEEKAGKVNCIISGFSSFEEAEIALSRLGNWLLNFLNAHFKLKGRTNDQLPPAITQEIRVFTSQLERWGEAFETLSAGLRSRNATSSNTKIRTFQNRYSALKIEHEGYTISILEFTFLSKSELAFVNRTFRGMLKEIEQMLDRLSLDSNLDLPSYSCNVSVVLTLFYIACKSRESQTREKALSMLDVRQRREGLWDSRTMATIARNLVSCLLRGSGSSRPVDGNPKSLDIRQC